MLNPQKLDVYYHEYITNMHKHLQDGILEVEESLLKELNILNLTEEEEEDIQEQLPFYFHVIENQEKVTLFNNQFVVWIIPKVEDDIPMTITLVALIQKNRPHLQLAFSTRDQYNTPKYVLRVLRHYLTEMIDTEEEIASIGKIDTNNEL